MGRGDFLRSENRDLRTARGKFIYVRRGTFASGDQPSVLLAFGQLLRSEIDVDVLVKRMVDLVAQAMDADRATLFLVDHERSEFYSRVAHLPEVEEIRLRIGEGIAGHVAATGEPISSSDAQMDKRFAEGVDEITGYRTRSLLAVPVREHQPNGAEEGQTPPRVVGVLEALNKSSDDHFDGEDLTLLQSLASQVSEALSLTHLDSPERPLRFNKIVGTSQGMRDVYDIIANAAATDATVLILGESGTGKERIARAIHINGQRADKPFVKVDCTAIPEGLIEAELFGHEKGAFTGADRLVYGKCEIAAGGTLFLDEIGDMPLPLQAKLLRFIQDREIERVGGRQVIPVDARVVTATNRNLEEAVRCGRFRTDLFYRIKVVEINLPTLRKRGAKDIVLLAHHFLSLYARKHGKPAKRLDPAAISVLQSYSWPGNIRELEHCIESAVVFCRTDTVMPAHLSLPQDTGFQREEPVKNNDNLPSGLALQDVERRYIVRTLAECGDNRTRAAQLLGIGRNTLVRKLKRYGIH